MWHPEHWQNLGTIAKHLRCPRAATDRPVCKQIQNIHVYIYNDSHIPFLGTLFHWVWAQRWYYMYILYILCIYHRVWGFHYKYLVCLESAYVLRASILRPMSRLCAHSVGFLWRVLQFWHSWLLWWARSLPWEYVRGGIMLHVSSWNHNVWVQLMGSIYKYHSNILGMLHVYIIYKI